MSLQFLRMILLGVITLYDLGVITLYDLGVITLYDLGVISSLTTASVCRLGIQTVSPS